MVEITSYVLVAIYLIVCEIGISSWVKKSTGQPVYESRKKWLTFYRNSILSAIAIIVLMGFAVSSQLIVVK